MKQLLAGLASGSFMASVFVAVGSSMVFAFAKDPPPIMRALLDRFQPVYLVMPVVILSYPVFGIVGILLALLLKAAEEVAPSGGLGSSNLVFTIAVASVTATVAGLLFYLTKRARIEIAIAGVTFGGVYGWLLPFLAR